MVNIYEGLVILPETLNEEAVDVALEKVKQELKGLNGSINNVTKLGRKMFARPMKKQVAGEYVLLNITLDGAQVTTFLTGLKLHDEIFRIQLIKKDAVAA